MTAGDRGGDQVGGLVELSGAPQFRGRDPDLGETEGRIAGVSRRRTIFGLREIGFQRDGEVGGSEHRRGQTDAVGRVSRRCCDSHWLFNARRGGRLDNAQPRSGSVRAGSGPGLGSRDLEVARCGGHHVTISDGDVHQPAERRLHQRLVVNPVRNLLAVRTVGRPQPCRGLSHHPLAEGEPAGIVHTIDLTGNPAETTAHTTTAHATAHAATHPAAHAHAAVHATGPAEAATGLKRVHARAGVDGQHEVRDRIHLHHQVLLGLFLRGDEQHLVFDEIRQVDVAEQQSQGRPQRNARQVLRDRRVEVDARILERLLVEFDRNVVGVADLGDDIAERRLVKLES